MESISRAILGLLAVVATSCAKSTYTCETTSQCVRGSQIGSCEESGYCSFADVTCGSGRRYAPYSSELSNQCVPANYMFVTSTLQDPGKIHVDGADLLCNQLASAAGLPGTYLAWLSTGATSAVSRLQQTSARGWIRPDGRPFADSISDLLAGKIYYPPRITEAGDDVEDRVATGTNAMGTSAGEMTANDFSTEAAAYSFGRTTAGKGVWTESEASPISGPSRLYCFATDLDSGIAVPPSLGRIAFVSRTPFVASSQLAGADTLCNQDGADLRVTFKALLATSQTPAAGRFAQEGPIWIRVDGIPLVTEASELFDAKLLAPIAVDPDGNYVVQSTRALTGAMTPTATGATGETCSDWASTAGTALAGRVVQSSSSFFWESNNSPASCASNAFHIYCLQDP